jgi:hypothetical protein
VCLDALAVCNDQLIEIPRHQFVERLPREASMNEGQSDIERHTAIGISDASKLEQCIAKKAPFQRGMILDQVIRDDRPRFAMKENDVLNQRVSSEWKLFEILCPALWRGICQKFL